ncbi:MAG: VCBS repeat-containing protein [Chitinophagaceae bacterium]
MGTVPATKQSTQALFIQSDFRNPGTYLYFFKQFTKEGEPVFSEGIQLKLPFKETGENKGIIFQDAGNHVWGIWQFEQNLLLSELDMNSLAFGQTRLIQVKDMPSRFYNFGIGQLPGGKQVLLFGITAKKPKDEPEMLFDSLYYTPEGFWPVSIQQSGLYGALVDDISSISTVNAVPLTGLDETYYNFSSYTFCDQGKASYAIAGTRLGNLFAYKINEKPFSLERKYVVDAKSNMQRNPSIHAYPGYIKFDSNHEGVIVSGEGGIYYYQNDLKKDRKGNLVFHAPVPVMQETPELYGGSLVVPELVDWDGDGMLDIISGASSGHILFFKNAGTNKQPQYLSPVPLKAGGEDIHIQPGYREDIQGPGEARWGYTCPAVIDWNEDGLPDLLTGDSRGKFMIYINRGTKTNPQLEPEQPLFFKGLNMFGGWRTRPGVAKMGGKTAYVFLDKDNEFHLYWRIDDYNVEDGGKLKMTNGAFITANRRPGGQVGRANIHLVDWDEDGVTDMMIGTGRAQAIPDPVNGLPYNRKKKNEGGAVLFMRNAGTDKEPVFEFPRLLKYKGEDMLFGAHSCAPATGRIGESGTLNLIVGVEKGIYMFYDRKDLSW